LPTTAQNLRCKNDFAEHDDSKLTVLTKCGESVLKDSSVAPNRFRPAPESPFRNPAINIDTWSYRAGLRQFVTIPEFQDGALRSVRYGDRIP